MTTDEKKDAAEGLAERINGWLGWRAADPEWRVTQHADAMLSSYTGKVVLSERGAQELLRKVAA